MALPTLEYTRIDTWTMTSGPGTVSLPMAGPTGTKPWVTMMISGIGVPGDATGSRLSNVRCTSSAFSPISCTWMGRVVRSTNQFIEVYRAANVPIGGASTTYFEFTWGGSCSGPCPYGGAEFAYWDCETVGVAGTSGGIATTNGTIIFGAVPVDTMYYGMTMGTTAAVSDWRLAGSSLMQTIYPNHATVPPEFTNNQTVLVGAVTQVGAPKVCCGFLAGPTFSNTTYGFSFAANTTWAAWVLELVGAATPIAVASQMVTILG